MRIAVYGLCGALLAVPVVAQEVPIVPETLPTLHIDLSKVQPVMPAAAKHISWPHLTLAYGPLGEGSFIPRFWYRVQDRSIPVWSNSLETKISAKRWVVIGQRIWTPGTPDTGRWFVGGMGTPAMLGHLRFGAGFWFSKSSDAYALFTSGDALVVATSARQAYAYVVDLGVGPYDRSYVRAQLLYGNAWVSSSLDLHAGDVITGSLPGLRSSGNSDFIAFGVIGAIPYRQFTLDGSATEYWPTSPSYALSHACFVLNGTLSYMSSHHVGVFARGTLVSGLPSQTDQSLVFLHNSWTTGLTVRVP